MDDYKILDKIRIEISTNAQEAQVLFNKINDNEDCMETMVLSGLGAKVCDNICTKCDEFERALTDMS